MCNSLSISGSINRLLDIYQQLLASPSSFDAYECSSSEIDELHNQLSNEHLQLSEEDKVQLTRVKYLHDQLIEVIQNEKMGLLAEKATISRQIVAVAQYGKSTGASSMDSIFFDKKR